MGRGETNKGYVGTKVCLSDQFEVEKKKRDEKVNLFALPSKCVASSFKYY